MDEETRIQLMAIDNKIRTLQNERESILEQCDLTTKEHYEFYHG